MTAARDFATFAFGSWQRHDFFCELIKTHSGDKVAYANRSRLVAKIRWADGLETAVAFAICWWFAVVSHAQIISYSLYVSPSRIKTHSTSHLLRD
ncbi:glycerate dehydrogenase [Sesbania bispinosa]|nr:glycerate dehydrogenase [Sesbania bispinosa]